jgi:hypothetical protein
MDQDERIEEDEMGAACSTHGWNAYKKFSRKTWREETTWSKGKVIPLYAMEVHGVRGGIAPTLS